MKPLVSVLTPCYNSATTLPLALASLLAQTYENWECVLVDDGSTDHPERIVEAADDPRIRYLRLECNMGRGFARQVTLDNARGEFIAMLDADDWYYPEKLERQVEFMLRHPEVAVVSAGMAIVDARRELIGVRLRGAKAQGAAVRHEWRSLASPPVAFAPSLIQGAVARQIRFRVDFRVAEDSDYLWRLLWGRRWAVLPQVLYAYMEPASATPAKVQEALRNTRRKYRELRWQFPIPSLLRELQATGKAAAYWMAAKAGLWGFMIARRSRRPTEEERSAYYRARDRILRVVAEVFGEKTLRERIGR